ncbi:hypothetical protein [Sorangium sp. So ce233]|uniref:hypothetical protein n=1 Tax=Sorangium sp. So ce233 TaxID=3133290 RepID=UPI003F64181F
MARTVRLTGWTAIEAAERAGLKLSKATDPTDGARDGLSVDEARAVAAEDPSLIFVEAPVPSVRQIKVALEEAGITGLKIELYADDAGAAGAVVNDGDCLWTCRPERLLRAAESLVEDGTAERLTRLDGEDQSGRYDALCRRVTYLARGSAEDRVLHERVVAEWREEHQSEGNWS